MTIIKTLVYLALGSILVINCRGATTNYVYQWTPQAVDVTGPGSAQYALLSALLRLTKPVPYTVVTGDSVDYILRKKFFVSQSNYSVQSVVCQAVWD